MTNEVNVQAQAEPTTEENANMIRQLFEGIVNKAINATDMAKRVAQLTEVIAELQESNRVLRNDLAQEMASHEETKRRLAAVEADLARKEGAVHDLVIERDIAIEERNGAQRERDEARAERNAAQSAGNVWEGKYNEEVAANAVLRERCERLAERIAAFRSAYSALNEAA